jgi:hypothetical protein
MTRTRRITRNTDDTENADYTDTDDTENADYTDTEQRTTCRTGRGVSEKPVFCAIQLVRKVRVPCNPTSP